LLPHQLIISEKETKIEVKVTTCFFKGSHYLIEAMYKESPIFFNYPEAIKKDKIVYLSEK